MYDFDKPEPTQEEIDNKIAFARFFMRKDRPLPKKGCSWAFFIFLGVLTLYLIISFITYKNI